MKLTSEIGDISRKIIFQSDQMIEDKIQRLTSLSKNLSETTILAAMLKNHQCFPQEKYCN